MTSRWNEDLIERQRLYSAYSRLVGKLPMKCAVIERCSREEAIEILEKRYRKYWRRGPLGFLVTLLFGPA